MNIPVALIMLLWLGFMTGCASDGPELPKPIDLYIKSSADVNNSRMVYLLIRSVNEKQFIDEGYNLVSDKAFPKTEDPTLLGTHPIFPSETRIVQFMMPPKGNAAVYFLFTEPGPYWKTLLQLPIEDSYGIELSNNNKVVIGEKPGFFDRILHY